MNHVREKLIDVEVLLQSLININNGVEIRERAPVIEKEEEKKAK